jgi:integrase
MDVAFSSPFLERVRAAVRMRHYSIRTEQAYLHWVRRFILFHQRRHPEQMGEAEVAAFLSDLALRGRVAPATQNQALNALAFLYRAVLDRPLAEIGGIVRARRRERLPVVLTTDEVGRLLSHLSGDIWLVACLQYGSGLRLLESVRLRIKDLALGVLHPLGAGPPCSASSRAFRRLSSSTGHNAFSATSCSAAASQRR